MSEMKTVCRSMDVDVLRIFHPKRSLRDDAGTTERVLRECERIQRSVWEPKESIAQNTIDTDLLFLLSSGERFVGFQSANFKKINGQSVTYLHDVMIEPEYQGRGFSRLMALLLVLDISNTFSLSRFQFVTATANSRLITTLYTKRNIFKEISFPKPSPHQQALLPSLCKELIRADGFESNTCLLKGVWLPQGDTARQHISASPHLTHLLGMNLDPRKGDALAILSTIDEESILNANSYLRVILRIPEINLT